MEGPKSLLVGFFLLTKPGVRAYVIIPFLLNSSLFALSIFFGAHRLNSLIYWLTSNWIWTAWLSWLLWPLFAFMTLTLVFFCFSIIANLISAPFNGFLAKAVAIHLRGEKQTRYTENITSVASETLSGFKSEAIKLSYFLIRALPLMLLLFIPILQAFAPIIWFLFGAWMLALEYMEYPMGNQGLLFSEVRSELKTKRGMFLGFGSSVMLLNMIPILNFIVMPTAVAAATKIWFDGLDTEREKSLLEQK